jgi:uncharacterized protein (TIGR03435 family)
MRSPLGTVARLCILLTTTLLPAQIPDLPRFEVATIKPSNLETGGMMGAYTYSGGKVFVGFATLRSLVQEAFHLQSFQVSGGAQWMTEDKYDVTGLPPDSSPLRKLNPSSISVQPNDEQRQMLLALLIDRFGLKYHEQTKEGPVYLLVRENAEPNKQLKPTEEKDKDKMPFTAVLTYAGGSVKDGEIMGTNASMPFVAERLSRYLDRPVIDQTKLKGAFDFDVPPPGDAKVDPSNAIFEGMPHLGLKLKPAKAPVKTIVIDSATKPTEN